MRDTRVIAFWDFATCRDRKRAALTAALILTASIVGCANKPDIVGRWEGNLDVSSAKGAPGVPASGALRLVFNFEKKDGTYAGTMTSPDQSPLAINLDNLTHSDGSVQLRLNRLQVSFEGELSSTGDELSGQFKQGPASFPLTLKRVK